ncbi:hypothetical protein BY458DRAFT_307561 [Sporodiniella umbellata]|nr:hypothetical protein BY458DRAFT_307561 [Sporodiniella umbellata]
MSLCVCVCVFVCFPSQSPSRNHIELECFCQVSKLEHKYSPFYSLAIGFCSCDGKASLVLSNSLAINGKPQ